MTSDRLAGVTGAGCVLLGNHVGCDGFHYSAAVRVQTHVHSDHMRGFETSKMYQTIFVSRGTYDLLVVQKNADLPYRSNFKALPFGEPHSYEHGTLILRASGHMLGAAQVEVHTDGGPALGYSGDFYWPCDDVVQVDVLVLDSTCGSPQLTRPHTEEEINERLVFLVLDRLAQGPVLLTAHQGTLHRALDSLDGHLSTPVVADAPCCEEIRLYSDYGYSMPVLYALDSTEGREAVRDRRYLRIRTTKGKRPDDVPEDMTSIVLSAHSNIQYDPVLRYGDRSYRVAMSSHADFHGTLAYVEATKATHVVTDSYPGRGGHAAELAEEIRRHLGISAEASSGVRSRAWGE